MASIPKVADDDLWLRVAVIDKDGKLFTCLMTRAHFNDHNNAIIAMPNLLKHYLNHEPTVSKNTKLDHLMITFMMIIDRCSYKMSLEIPSSLARTKVEVNEVKSAHAAELASMQKERDSVRDEAMKLSHQLDSLTLAHKTLEDELARTKSLNHRLTVQSIDSQRKIGELNETLKEVLDEKTDLRTQLIQAKIARTSNPDDLREIERLRSALDENQALKQSLDHAGAIIAGTNDRLAALLMFKSDRPATSD